MKLEIAHEEATQNPSLRQKYLDCLVKASGANSSYIETFKYVSDTEAKNLGLISERPSSIDQRAANMSTKPINGVPPSPSNVYIHEDHFSPNFNTIRKAGIPEEEINICHGLEMAVHEKTHAENYSLGIDGLPFTDFDFSCETDKLLFSIASELDAHSRHLIELGKQKTKTNYIAVMQKGFAGHFKCYLASLPHLAKDTRINAKLARKIFDRFNGLRFKNPQYDYMILPY